MKKFFLVVMLLVAGKTSAGDFMDIVNMSQMAENNRQLEEIRKQMGVPKQTVHWIPIQWQAWRGSLTNLTQLVTMLYSPEMQLFMIIHWKDGKPTSTEIYQIPAVSK